MITFTVHGEAATAGSKRAFVLRRKDGSFVTRKPGGPPIVNVTDDNPRSKDWKRTVAWSARQAHPRPNLLEGPLRVTFEFNRPRPKGHFNGKGELNKKGREAQWPATKPDVLKLARAAEDALTGVLWRDDAQIVQEFLSKCWGSDARLVVTVEEL